MDVCVFGIIFYYKEFSELVNFPTVRPTHLGQSTTSPH